MHQLRQAAQILDGLPEFIDAVTQFELTQGVVVDLNPIWAWGYRINDAGFDFDALVREAPWMLPWEQIGWRSAMWEGLLRADPQGYVDLGWRSEVVDAMTSQVFQRPLSNPQLLVRVSVPPITNPEMVGTRQAIAEITRSAPFPAVVETRTPARFVVNCGDACSSSSGSRGTIGGFLRDINGQRDLAVTCGHVVQSGSVVVNGASIGQCTHARSPSVQTQGQQCSVNSQNLTRLDIALIDVTGQSVTNSARLIASTVYATESLSVRGGATGSQNYEVGGACMVYRVGGVCFANLFELRPPTPSSIISPRIQNLVATVPQPGDSGSWVERTASSEWCGMVVAADHGMGYALEADEILNESTSAFGLLLDLL